MMSGHLGKLREFEAVRLGLVCCLDHCHQKMLHELVGQRAMYGFLGKFLILRLTERLFLMSGLRFGHFRWLVIDFVVVSPMRVFLDLKFVRLLVKIAEAGSLMLQSLFVAKCQ